MLGYDTNTIYGIRYDTIHCGICDMLRYDTICYVRYDMLLIGYDTIC